MTIEPNTELLTVDDVARITGLTAATVRSAVNDGELAATKLRRRIRVHPDDLAAWLDAGRVQPPVDLVDVPAHVPPPRLRQPPPNGGYRQAARARRHAA